MADASMPSSVRLAAALASMLAAAVPISAQGADARDPPKRPLPDYEGRPPAPATPGEAMLWIPRVVFSPVYFTTEYLIRRPLGAMLTAAERANLPSALYDFFAFGPEHKAGIAPIAFVDFGFNPSVGVYAFWDDALVRGNDLRLHFSAWNQDWMAGSFVQRTSFHDRDTLTVKVAAMRRPDQVFYGIGPTTLQSNQSRYAEDRFTASGTAEVRLWRSSSIQTGIGVRASSFANGHFGGDPGIVEAAAQGAYPLPYGFASGYTAEYNRVAVALDSRRPFPNEGSGVRLEAAANEGNDVSQSPGSGWLRYEGAAGAFLDLDGHRRIVSLSVQTFFADPLGTRPIPFTELVSLGGDQPMPGFYDGRLIDRSAAVGTLRYRWPIGPWVDGALQAALGNVFGAHLEGFDSRLLRFSGALGIETDSSPDSNFQLLVGFGTETFDHGGQVDSARLVLGISRGL
jgi:hypothetical protein